MPDPILEPISESTSETIAVASVEPIAEPTRPSLRALLRDGAGSLYGRAPNWAEIPASPWLVLVLFSVAVGAGVLFEWAFAQGGALQFYWRALFQTGALTLIWVWVLYWLQAGPKTPTSLVAALNVSYTQTLLFYALFAAIAAITGNGLIKNNYVQMALFGIQTLWFVVAGYILLWHASAKYKWRFVVALVLLSGITAFQLSGENARYWYPKRVVSDEPERAKLVLTQELIEAQPKLLADKLAAIAPQRAGVVDLYTLTFAPEADEDVFRREADMVSVVMAKRFDAAGRGIELINHVDTLKTWPWATPLNLQRSIASIASKMDPGEDILFLHLTSHGGKDGHLAASFWPLEVDSVTPQQLKKWLDEAGIVHRVISISACFSGSWIAPLADDNTLVMTAADSDHTSFGCGRQSPLTFFGRAMYDEQLRTKTLSFEAAHAAAREVIRQREIAAGKDDGYSNPQIRVGSAIRAPLQALQTRLQSQASAVIKP